MLTLAGREADIVALNPSLHAGVIDANAGPSATADATEEKLRWIAEAAGDRYVDIELADQGAPHRHHRRSPGPGRGHRPHPRGVPGPGARHTHTLAGTVDEVVEQCIERRERFGLSYISISADAHEAFAPVVARLAGT